MSVPGFSPRFRDLDAERRQAALRIGALVRSARAPNPAPPEPKRPVVQVSAEPRRPGRPRLPRSPKPPPAPRAAKHPPEAVIAAYREHRTLLLAGRALGISSERVRQILRRAGEPVFAPGQTRHVRAMAAVPLARLAEAYGRLGRLEAAAAECRLTVERARAMVREAGIGKRGRRAVPVDELVDAYKARGSVTAVARTYRMRKVRLRQLLLDAGVALRPPNGAKA